MGSEIYDAGVTAIQDAVVRHAISWLRERAGGVEPDSVATREDVDFVMLASIADLFEAVAEQRDVLRDLAAERLETIRALTARRDRADDHWRNGGWELDPLALKEQADYYEWLTATRDGTDHD